MACLRRAAALLICAAFLTGPVLAQPPRPWPDTFLARLEALALVESLNATLLAARSATFTLDSWCADHKLASEPKIRARLIRDIDKPATPEQRARLEVGEDEQIKFRHVELACGDHVFSIADNWYVPSRLTPTMNRSLETSDTPFGRAVADLKPFRRTFAAETLWKPLEDGWELKASPPDRPGEALAIPERLFEHHALLFTPDLKPFSEVDETYTREILSFGPPP